MPERFSIVRDVDGVLHLGRRPIPSASRFAAALARSGRKCLAGDIRRERLT